MAAIHSSDHDGGVRVLTLERPPANAIDEVMLADLAAECDRAAADEAVRAVVLTGAGAFFCAGFDFRAPRRGAVDERALYALYRAAHVKLLAMPKPTLAMINGHAIAGGFVLALACDYRLAVEGAYRIGLNEVAVGASFPRAAMEMVRLRLPHARAAELILGAVLYPSSEAVRLGLADEILPAETFASTVLRRAARLGGFAREAYAHSKRALVNDALVRIEEETAEEAAQTIAVWNTPESRAARARQRDKLGVRRA